MHKPLEAAKTARTLPEGTHMGEVHIAVTDADSALAIWRDVVGLHLIARDHNELHLGVGDKVLIVLHADARQRARQRALGLYHVAIHVPTRRDLARFVVRASRAGIRISPTDHLVTEAIYLWDEDGNGIEITFETPWRGTLGNSDNPEAYGTTTDGKPHSGREPIDLQNLIEELEGDETPDAPFPEGTRIGHVHVHVTDLDKAMNFYARVIGFEELLLLPKWGMGDAGLGYMPHAMAFNIWSGPGASQPPADAAGLRWFEINLPDSAAQAGVVERLKAAGAPVRSVGDEVETEDPFGNRLRLRVATA